MLFEAERERNKRNKFRLRQSEMNATGPETTEIECTSI